MMTKRKTILIIIILVTVVVLAFFVHDDIICYFSHEDMDSTLNVLLELPYNPFEGDRTVVHVKMTALKHNFSHEKRSEYCFDVIEWIKGGNGQNKISAYSAKYYNNKAWGWLEYQKGYNYQIGKEYILCLNNDEEFYTLGWQVFFPIESYETESLCCGNKLFEPLNSYYNMPSGLSEEEVVEFVRMFSYNEIQSEGE